MGRNSWEEAFLYEYSERLCKIVYIRIKMIAIIRRVYV